MFHKFTIYLLLILSMLGCRNDSVSDNSLEPKSAGQPVAEEHAEQNETVVVDLPIPPAVTTASTEQNKTAVTVVTKPQEQGQEHAETTDKAWITYCQSQLHLSLKENNITVAHIKPEKKVFFSSFEDAHLSVKLDGATEDNETVKSGKTSVRFQKKGDVLVLQNIPVEEGRWYVISGFMRVAMLPADVMRYYVEFQRHGKGVDIPNYPMFAVSKAGEWEEFVLPVYIKKDLGIDSIKVLFRDVGRADAKDADKSELWIDDITVYEVKNSASLFGLTPPQPKKGFDGALVSVDRLGNFSVKEGDSFKPFLPVIIYPDAKLQSWDKYREKGFNTVICNGIKQAKRATELGMHWIWSLYDYGIYDGDEKGYARFEREYALLRKSYPDVLEKLLYFYWDNERYQLFDTIRHFSDTIAKIDIDGEGRRLRPFTMQLDFTTANPHYINDTYGLVDLQSCYANPMVFEENDPLNYQGVEFKGNYDGEFANFAIFEHLPGVQIPKTVFVVNSPFGDKHIANTIFAAFARGGRGFAYWKDGGSQPAVEKKAWWKGFEKTVDQMQQLLPLLRTPHGSDWNLTASLPDDEDGLVVGKRDFGAYRCMIAASRSNKEEKVRFKIEDMPDQTKVFDYFSGQTVVESRDGVFELQFVPRGYGAWCWEAGEKLPE